jgi:hypothetical protein
MTKSTPPLATTTGLRAKSFEGFEIKNGITGEVEAVIATLNVVDHDAEVIWPGAIKDGSKVKMSSYGHDIVGSLFGGGAMPVGKGAITVEGNRAVFRGRVFQSTERGRETFSVLKEMGRDQEWSFGFRILESQPPDEDWLKRGAERILTKLEVFEVSPVLLGAGVGTTTLSAKCTACGARSPCECGARQPARAEPTRAEIADLAARSARVLAQQGALLHAPASSAEVAETERILRDARRALNLLPKVAVDAERQDWAREVASWGAKQWQVAPPLVKWFSRLDAPDAAGMSYPGAREIWLCSDLRAPAQVAKITLHELSHYARGVRGLPNTEAEVRADTAALLARFFSEAA